MKEIECCTVESQECIAKRNLQYVDFHESDCERGESRPVYSSVFEGRQPSSAASDFSL